MKFIFTQPRGFVMLFTILISAIILMIGLGIFSIATRETVLSGTAREAQAAFYAADAGVECALFLDATVPIWTNFMQFNCGETVITTSGDGTSGTPVSFDVLVDADNKTCAHVSIFDQNSTRRIISQGYNICYTSGPKIGQKLAANPLLVERDLDTSYARGGSSIPSATLPTASLPTGTLPTTSATPFIPLPGGTTRPTLPIGN